MQSIECLQTDVQQVLKSEVALFQDPDFKPEDRGIQKHCILLHGWNSSGNDMLRIRDAITSLPKGGYYRYWWVTYDTNAPFKENARKIIDLFNKQNIDFSNCLLVCYSMGGVVGRSMIAQGFNVQNLVTICTPHLGLAPWVPTPTPGTMSIAPWSQDLKELNGHPRDTAKRNSYYFYGITFSDILGEHPDDAVVEFNSAIGNVLGQGIKRVNIPLSYHGALAGTDPHARGMDPNYLGPVLQQINLLM